MADVRQGEPVYFTWIVAIALWLTVLFANLAEAVAEGRGKAQADALRKTRTTTPATLVEHYDETNDADAQHASTHQGALRAQRELVEKLGGTYHQIVGEDIADALVAFAWANNATQIIIGVSRRSPMARLFGRASSTTGVIEKSGTIDVHVVTHSYASTRGLRFHRFGKTISRSRMAFGFLFEAVTIPLLAALLFQFMDGATAPRDALLLQLFVVFGAMIGGIGPALLGSLLSGLALDFMYIMPAGTFHMPRWQDWITMLLYVVIGVIVAMIVDQGAERTRQAQRASAESETLAMMADAALRSTDPLHALMARTREALTLDCVRLRRASDEIIASDGEPPADEHPDTMLVSKGVSLELYGHAIDAADQRLLRAIITQIQTVMEHDDLQKKAKEVGPLAAAERIRTALLNAVSHDLRRPLAAATAAVSGLQRMGASMSETDKRELLGVADDSLHQLSRLVNDLLDVSRLREGAMPVSMVAADVGEPIVSALDEQHIGPSRIDLDLEPDLPLVMADPPLLRRAISNVLLNAMRYTPAGKRVRISASSFKNRVEIRVADRGPGVPDDRKADIFVPFHRLGDTDNTAGLGLGMTLSKGFVEAMGGEMDAEDTPGGGLTMVTTLRTADPSLALGEPIPKEQVPDPTQEMGEGTLRAADAVSDVILPLDGEGEAALRRLGRFMRDDSPTDGITPAAGGGADDHDLDAHVTHVDLGEAGDTAGGASGAAGGTASAASGGATEQTNGTRLGEGTDAGGKGSAAGGKEG